MMTIPYQHVQILIKHVAIPMGLAECCSDLQIARVTIWSTCGDRPGPERFLLPSIVLALRTQQHVLACNAPRRADESSRYACGRDFTPTGLLIDKVGSYKFTLTTVANCESKLCASSFQIHHRLASRCKKIAARASKVSLNHLPSISGAVGKFNPAHELYQEKSVANNLRCNITLPIAVPSNSFKLLGGMLTAFKHAEHYFEAVAWNCKLQYTNFYHILN